ncbi:MAG TPA: ComF family protein [Nitrospira sp.]|nr:ComF family protein [Nitrospira sp.]HMW86001.1 ComF family protein [Nitrospira sp.]
MIMDFLRQASRLLLPMDCTTCAQPLADDPVPFFCRRCWELIRPLRGPSCPRCHRPFASPSALTYSPTHECQDCRTREPYYSQVWAPYAYCSPLQDAIALFKYRGKVALADALGVLLLQAIPDRLDVDVLMPIPLHPTRLRQREFNQSLLIADRIGSARRLPVSYRNLIRTVDTAPQTSLPRAARLQNLRKAFAIRQPKEITGARILLVDDVFTTGTTASECARVLLTAGAKQVAVLALARSADAGMVPDTWLPPSTLNQTEFQRA